MDIKLIPSLACANMENLGKEVTDLEAAGADMFHMDIMDGQYVENFALGLGDLEVVCKKATVPVDAHLAIVNPGKFIDLFAKTGVDIIYVHPNAEFHPVRTLQKIQAAGVKPGVALNPGTSVEEIMPLLPFAKYILIMSVNPGFAGQKYIPYVEKKAKQLAQLKEEFGYDYEMVLDGAVSKELIDKYSEIGVKGFVLGTSALFGKEESYEDLMNNLRK